MKRPVFQKGRVMKRILATGTSLIALLVASSAHAGLTASYAETGTYATFIAPLSRGIG